MTTRKNAARLIWKVSPFDFIVVVAFLANRDYSSTVPTVS